MRRDNVNIRKEKNRVRLQFSKLLLEHTWFRALIYPLFCLVEAMLE